eukprot:Awhi_evm2s3804
MKEMNTITVSDNPREQKKVGNVLFSNVTDFSKCPILMSRLFFAIFSTKITNYSNILCHQLMKKSCFRVTFQTKIEMSYFLSHSFCPLGLSLTVMQQLQHNTFEISQTGQLSSHPLIAI